MFKFLKSKQCYTMEQATISMKLWAILKDTHGKLKKKIALPDTKKKKFLVLNFALQNDKNKLIWFAWALYISPEEIADLLKILSIGFDIYSIA